MGYLARLAYHRRTRSRRKPPGGPTLRGRGCNELRDLEPGRMLMEHRAAMTAERWATYAAATGVCAAATLERGATAPCSEAAA